MQCALKMGWICVEKLTLGVDAAQVPFAEQAWPLGQVPHEPPQPSGPQLLPAQLGAQPAVHWPALEQV